MNDLGPTGKSRKLLFLENKRLSLGRPGLRDKEIGGCTEFNKC